MAAVLGRVATGRIISPESPSLELSTSEDMEKLLTCLMGEVEHAWQMVMCDGCGSLGMRQQGENCAKVADLGLS